MCFHNATIHWYDDSQPDCLYYPKLIERDYSGQELLSTRIPTTASLVFRSEICEKYLDVVSYPNVIVGDRPLNVLCAQSGKVHAIPGIMSVYGKHQGGWATFDDAEKTYRYGLSMESEREVYEQEYYAISTSMMTGLYLNALIRSIRQRKIKTFFKSLYRGIVRQPITGIKSLLMIPGERKKRLK